MTLPRRGWYAAALALVATAGLSAAHPSWPTDVGVDFWNVPVYQQKLARDTKLREELTQRDAAVMRRIGIKEVVVADLVAGKIDLLEAAADFRALNLAKPESMTMVRRMFPAATEDEALCLNVLGFVDSSLHGRPGHGKTLRRLRAELNRHRAAGTLKLPNVELSEEF